MMKDDDDDDDIMIIWNKVYENNFKNKHFMTIKCSFLRTLP